MSPAKLNLWLRVLGRRPDGFHEIESLVVRLGFVDELTVAPAVDGSLRITCNDPTIPTDESNLVIRAAHALRAFARDTGRAAQDHCGAEFRLNKRIPAGSGLGGGSSNAAAALRLLNELWQVGAPDVELAQIGARLGSDVALFFHSPLCLVRGRGEQIEDLSEPPGLWAALVLPPVHCPTAEVYAAWSSQPSASPRPAPAAMRLPPVAAEAMAGTFNDLQAAAGAVRPALADWVRRIEKQTGRQVRMTGSGAGLFHLFDTEGQAREFAESVSALGVRAEAAQLAQAGH